MRSSVATMTPPRAHCLVTVQTYAERERFLQRRQQLEQQHAAQVSAGLALSAARERGLRVERTRQDAQEAEREVTRLVRRNGPRHPPPPLPAEGSTELHQVDGGESSVICVTSPTAPSTSGSGTCVAVSTASSSAVSASTTVSVGVARVVSKPPLPSSATNTCVSTFQTRLRPVQQQQLTNRTPSPAPYCPTPDYDSDSSGSTLHTTSTSWVATNGHVNGSATAGHVNGSATAGHVNGSATAGHVNGSATAGHVNGSPTAGHVNGSATAGHVNGSATAGHVNRSPTAGHVNGSPTAGHVNGSPTAGHVNGSPTAGHVNGSPTANGTGGRSPISGHVNGRLGHVNGHVNGRTVHVNKVPEVEMQSLDSLELLEPRTKEPRPPQTYFQQLSKAMNSPRPSVCVTIREYGSANNRTPSKLTFLPPQTGGSTSQHDGASSGLQSELASTLSRSNLRSKTDIIESVKNGHPKEAEEAPIISEEVSCGNITVTSVNGTASTTPYTPKVNMPNGILKKAAVNPMASNGIPVGHGITPAILAGAGAALNKTKGGGVSTKTISFGAKATIINEKHISS